LRQLDPADETADHRDEYDGVTPAFNPSTTAPTDRARILRNCIAYSTSANRPIATQEARSSTSGQPARLIHVRIVARAATTERAFEFVGAEP